MSVLYLVMYKNDLTQTTLAGKLNNGSNLHVTALVVVVIGIFT